MLGFSCFLVFFIENHEKSLKKCKKMQKMDFAPPEGFSETNSKYLEYLFVMFVLGNSLI